MVDARTVLEVASDYRASDALRSSNWHGLSYGCGWRGAYRKSEVRLRSLNVLGAHSHLPEPASARAAGRVTQG